MFERIGKVVELLRSHAKRSTDAAPLRNRMFDVPQDLPGATC
jgi:hypothetical protein